MEFIWLYSLCQCTLSLFVIVVSVRLCMAVSSSRAVTDVQQGAQGAGIQPGSVSSCLRLCLGCVGAVGGAIGVPVTLLLNLQTSQCLYTCMALLCCPLLIRQFTMFLLILLTLDAYLQHHLADRYSSVVTRRRALCVVLLCWLGSVLSSFALFIGSDFLSSSRSKLPGLSTEGHGLKSNWTTSSPPPSPTSVPRYFQDRQVIAKFLPYGGFLSKFYVEDMNNFTYAEIHSSHWGVCVPEAIVRPQFLVYIHGVTVFILPFLFLLAIYLDLLCIKPKKTCFSNADVEKRSNLLRVLVLSMTLLVLLCLPIYIIQALMLFNSHGNLPVWAHDGAMFLFEVYTLVPPILFTPPRKPVREQTMSFPLTISNFPSSLAHLRGKSVHMALREVLKKAPWSSAKHSLETKA
ncbi:uncharacterized protein LOC119797861 [Cyprinodon tularosa]|uniref:uncharacterized protein LOC119797861 n=1 Tax=Cyprinodon tularosa TaxID=77115 RepID=UPI0018E21C10|nr:uncharacterized protein LOC119797861 [Cyprinodon tularosa]